MGLNALLKNMTRKETKTAPVKSAAKKSKWKMVEVDGAVYAVKKTLSQLVDGQKVVGDLVIPERVGDLPVRSIAEKAFFGNKKIETVIIPPQVRKLGASAFEGCKALKIVDHPVQFRHGFYV